MNKLFSVILTQALLLPNAFCSITHIELNLDSSVSYGRLCLPGPNLIETQAKNTTFELTKPIDLKATSFSMYKYAPLMRNNRAPSYETETSGYAPLGYYIVKTGEYLNQIHYPISGIKSLSIYSQHLSPEREYMLSIGLSFDQCTPAQISLAPIN